MVRSAPTGCTVARVQREVAFYYGLEPSDMVSAVKSRSLAWPRQIAMLLSRRLTAQSLPQIGKRFGNRDHTTVMHGIAAAKERAATDKEVARDIQALMHRLSV